MTPISRLIRPLRLEPSRSAVPPKHAPALARRAHRPLAAAVTLLLAAIAAATPALAQSHPDMPQPQVAIAASAAELYDRGVAAAKGDDWQAAYEEFLVAWKVKEHHQIGAQLGRAELNIGKHRDAAEHLTYVLHGTADVIADDRALVQQILGGAKARIATLTIPVNRDSAEVLIGGVVSFTPLGSDVSVDPGTRTVEARAGGSKSYGPSAPKPLEAETPLDLDASANALPGAHEQSPSIFLSSAQQTLF